MSDFERSRQPARGRRGGRALTITLLVSLGLHLAAATAILLLLPRGGALVDGPERPSEVELVMEEHKGDAHPVSPQAASAGTSSEVKAEQPPDRKPPKAARPAETPPAAAPRTVEAPKDQPEKTAAPAKPSVPAEAASQSPLAHPAAPPPVEAQKDQPEETAAPPKPSVPTEAASPSPLAHPAVPPPVEAQKDQPEETAAPPKPPVPTEAVNPSPMTHPAVPPPVEAQKDQPEQKVALSKPTIPTEAATSAQEPNPEVSANSPAPKITLSGTDSPSYARAWGDRILPAAPDAVFHNRPPEYPPDAAENGEHGTVVVLIHISPAGTAAAVDVVRSSGYAMLDRAAREAVLRWRFLPAVKDGLPVASDMKMGFVFDYE